METKFYNGETLFISVISGIMYIGELENIFAEKISLSAGTVLVYYGSTWERLIPPVSIEIVVESINLLRKLTYGELYNTYYAEKWI